MLNIPFLGRRKSKHWQQFVERLQNEERLMLETRRYVSLALGTTCAMCYTHYDLAPGKVDLRVQIRAVGDTQDHRFLFFRDDQGGWALRIDAEAAVPVATPLQISQAIQNTPDVRWHFMVNWTLVETILGFDMGSNRLYRIQEECLHSADRSQKNPNAQEKEKRVEAGVIVRRQSRGSERQEEFWLYLPDYRLFSSRQYTTERGLVFMSEYIDIEEHPTFRPPILEELSDYLPSNAALEGTALADSSA